MSEQPDRVEEFKAEIESMKLRGSSAEGERRWLGLGLVAGAAGLVLTVIGGIQVTSNTAPADQRAFMATGTFLGIALLIAGGTLFLRYSMARYLRFWLIRMIHESRTNTDRIVAAIEGRDLGPTGAADGAATDAAAPGPTTPPEPTAPGSWGPGSDLQPPEARP